MMTAGEYILSLLAIVSALSLSELVFGLHTLLDHRSRIAWDWLPLVAAAHLFVVVLFAFWVSWGSWHANDEPVIFGLFLIPVAQLVCLFLAARTVLPRANDATGGGIDLAAHYLRTHRLLWGALAANTGLILIGYAIRTFALHDTRMVIPGTWMTLSLAFIAALALAVFPSRALHRVLVPLGMFATLVTVAPQVLR